MSHDKKVTPFGPTDEAIAAGVKSWVDQQQADGKSVKIVFVNGILHDMEEKAEDIAFLNVLQSHFRSKDLAWFKNKFMSTQFVHDVSVRFSNVWKETTAKVDPFLASLVALTAISLDMYATGGQITSTVFSKARDAAVNFPWKSTALSFARHWAKEHWGEHGVNTDKLRTMLERNEGKAVLLVGHSFGAMSLATAYPHLQSTSSTPLSFLLLGSPVHHETPAAQMGKPIFSILHKEDIVGVFRETAIEVTRGEADLGEIDQTLEHNLLTAEAHSLRTYSLLFPAQLEPELKPEPELNGRTSED